MIYDPRPFCKSCRFYESTPQIDGEGKYLGFCSNPDTKCGSLVIGFLQSNARACLEYQKVTMSNRLNDRAPQPFGQSRSLDTQIRLDPSNGENR